MNMKTLIDGNVTVRELVRQHPQTRAALESLGIDYCCGGNVTLREAAAEQGVPVEGLLQALDEAMHSTSGPEVRDWSIASAAELVDHIVTKHHEYMRRELPRLADLFLKVERAHRRHLAMLENLERVFHRLRSEIELHLQKEEQVLFPLIRRIEGAPAGEKFTPPMPLSGPVGQMEHEHESAGSALAEMRTITDDYTLPDDACPTFAALYDGLKAMEADLHEHIHLENNILFPKGIEMERV